MSRRKQSNPKPLKRAEDEDDESDMTAKLDQSEAGKEMETDQSESSLQSESENEPQVEENEPKDNEKGESVEIEEELTDENKNNSRKDHLEVRENSMSPTRLGVMERLRFPQDLLTLRQVGESEFSQTGIPWSVTAQVNIPKGTTIGPYSGETIALSSIKPGELVLQFEGSDREFSFIKVLDETGAWLSLLRPADHTVTHNISVSFEGGKIWCEVVEDLDQGRELLASFTTSLSSDESNLPLEKKEVPEREMKLTVPSVKKESKANTVTPQPALIYGCPFCGVRFSSRRTLEAHLTYYCSKKPADFVSLPELHKRIQQQTQAHFELQAKLEEEANARKRGGSMSPKGVKRSRDSRSVGSADSPSESESPRLKSPRTGDVYKCPSCDFTTDKLTGFQQHRATVHGDREPTSEGERSSVSPSSQDEMYCRECKIQFSSISTYKGHKEFYCRYRQVPKDGDSFSNDLSPTSQSPSSDIAMKILKSPTFSLESQLLAAKGHIHSALLAANPALLHSPLFLQELFVKSHQGEVISTINQGQLPAGVMTGAKKSSMEDQPLDLSKSSKESSVEDGKDNISEVNVKTEPRSSPEQLSPSIKKRKVEEQKSMEGGAGGEGGLALPKTPLNIPNLHPAILIPGQVQYVNKKPIPPLQSVSRCVECNIVFYKHENYLIHKEHYCSGRRSKDSSSDTENPDNDQKENDSGNRQTGRNSVTPKHEKTSPEPKPDKELPIKEISYRHFCIPCKIKFSSEGTLKAHQEYYCPHGKGGNSDGKDGNKNGENSNDQIDGSNYRCENCKNVFSSARLLKLHICMRDVSPTPLQRCMYCDYVTQTENRLAEHMKVHVPTKAFKCNICGYRGNTARGMRMHGKIHLENGEEFTDENMIEYEEPPLVPVQRNGLHEKGPVNMEAELIRMKNEPYKRRRSRKSFEKSENMAPFLGQNLLSHICAACGQTFTNVSDFVIHLRMHEIAALEAVKSLKSLSCEHCTDYVADSLTNLLIHMQTKHPEQLPGTSRLESDRLSDERSNEGRVSSERSRSCSVESSKTNVSTSSQDTKSSNFVHMSNGDSSGLGYIEVKVEKNSDIESDVKSPETNDLPQNLQQSQFNTKSSKTSSEDTRSDTTSSKPVPSRHSSDSSLNREPTPSPRQQTSPSIKSEPKSPSISPDHIKQKSSSRPSSISPTDSLSTKSDSKMSPKLTSPDPKTRYLMNIKQEQMSPPILRKTSPAPSSPKTNPITSPKLPIPAGSPKLPIIYSPLLSPFQFGGALPVSLYPGARLQTSPTAPTSPVEKMGRKYCKHCDINFTYLSSFLTHKKYYCSARNTADETTQSPTATA